MATHAAPGAKPRINETGWAIIGSLVVSIILATVLAGNPFHALRLAYMDQAQVAATPHK